MNFLADYLSRSTMFNTNAQMMYLQANKLFLRELVIFLNKTNSNKLLSTLIRMLPLLSSNIHTKTSLIQADLILVLEKLLEKNSNFRIQRSCLLTLRNLSDLMIHMENLDSLIILLIRILSSNSDRQCQIYIVDILSNLSCENQSNKFLMIRKNLIQILIQIIKQSDQSDQIIESAMCTLRQLTGQCSLAAEARALIRINDAMPMLMTCLYMTEASWSLIKVCIGLIRNLALSTNNLKILCEYRCVYKIGQLFFQMKTKNERHELFLTTLLMFSEQNQPCHERVCEQIMNSSCVEVLVKFASMNYLGRTQQMSQMIVENLQHSQHRGTIKQIEKSVKIAQFL